MDNKWTGQLDRTENINITFKENTEICAHIFADRNVNNVRIIGTVSVKVANIISNSDSIQFLFMQLNIVN